MGSIVALCCAFSSHLVPLLRDPWLAPALTVLTVPLSLLAFQDLVKHRDQPAENIASADAQRQRFESPGRMARGVAHDVNNLLSRLSGHLELTRADLARSQPVDTHLQKAARAVERAGQLQRKLLAYPGEGMPPPLPLDPTPMQMALQKEAVAGVGQDILQEVHFDGPLPSLHILEADLHSLVQNLVLNAKEAIDESGRVVVKVAFEPVATPPAEAQGCILDGSPCTSLSVEDDGPGMSPAVLSKILEPFYTTKGEGRGMGPVSVLAVVREVGGALLVESEPGNGTRVRAWFPIAESSVTAEEQQRDADLPRGKILLVDDNPGVLEVLYQLLEMMGHQVASTHNAQDALNLLRTSPEEFDRALLDIRMPNMDGMELAQALLKQDPDVQIHLMSGDEPGSRIQEVFAPDQVQFLRNPLLPQTLENTSLPPRAKIHRPQNLRVKYGVPGTRPRVEYGVPGTHRNSPELSRKSRVPGTQERRSRLQAGWVLGLAGVVQPRQEAQGPARAASCAAADGSD